MEQKEPFSRSRPTWGTRQSGGDSWNLFPENDLPTPNELSGNDRLNHALYTALLAPDGRLDDAVRKIAEVLLYAAGLLPPSTEASGEGLSPSVVAGKLLSWIDTQRPNLTRTAGLCQVIPALGPSTAVSAFYLDAVQPIAASLAAIIGKCGSLFALAREKNAQIERVLIERALAISPPGMDQREAVEAVLQKRYDGADFNGRTFIDDLIGRVLLPDTSESFDIRELARALQPHAPLARLKVHRDSCQVDAPRYRLEVILESIVKEVYKFAISHRESMGDFYLSGIPIEGIDRPPLVIQTQEGALLLRIPLRGSEDYTSAGICRDRVKALKAKVNPILQLCNADMVSTGITIREGDAAYEVKIAFGPKSDDATAPDEDPPELSTVDEGESWQSPPTETTDEDQLDPPAQGVVAELKHALKHSSDSSLNPVAEIRVSLMRQWGKDVSVFFVARDAKQGGPLFRFTAVADDTVSRTDSHPTRLDDLILKLHTIRDWDVSYSGYRGFSPGEPRTPVFEVRPCLLGCQEVVAQLDQIFTNYDLGEFSVDLHEGYVDKYLSAVVDAGQTYKQFRTPDNSRLVLEFQSPASRVLFPGSIYYEAARLRILDSSGRVVAAGVFDEQTATFGLNTLPQESYFQIAKDALARVIRQIIDAQQSLTSDAIRPILSAGQVVLPDSIISAAVEHFQGLYPGLVPPDLDRQVERFLAEQLVAKPHVVHAVNFPLDSSSTTLYFIPSDSIRQQPTSIGQAPRRQ